MPPETEILSDLIRVKRECLQQLRDMGEKQMSFIAAGDMTSLMGLLAAKHRPLNTLKRIEKSLDPFRRQDPEKRVWRSREERARCAKQLQECEALLAEIVDQEKHCKAELMQRRDETARRLQGTHLASHAREAYGPQGNNLPSQIDLFSGK